FLFLLGRAWTLCFVPSLFLTVNVCPTRSPKTCGTYMQPCWSNVTAGDSGKPDIFLCGPSDAHTNAFGRAPPAPTTLRSAQTCASCLQSVCEAVMGTNCAAGAAPAHLTVTLTEAVDFAASYFAPPPPDGSAPALFLSP